MRENPIGHRQKPLAAQLSAILHMHTECPAPSISTLQQVVLSSRDRDVYRLSYHCATKVRCHMSVSSTIGKRPFDQDPTNGHRKATGFRNEMFQRSSQFCFVFRACIAIRISIVTHFRLYSFHWVNCKSRDLTAETLRRTGGRLDSKPPRLYPTPENTLTRIVPQGSSGACLV